MCDQVVDRTRGRLDTYFDGPVLNCIPFADPYCEELRSVVTAVAAEEGITAHARGTVVVIQGPRFSTRAESRWFSSEGWDVVNMTQYPECVLARELGMCYSGVALVTDYDVGLEGMPEVEPVSAEMAFRVFADNLARLRDLLFRAIPVIGPQPKDVCATALSSAVVH